MKPLTVIAQAVKLRREHKAMSQKDLAGAVAEYGASMDATAVLRIEQAARDKPPGKAKPREVRAGELLALALALDCTPAELLAPTLARSLTLGRKELSAAKVFAWFAGDHDAPHRRSPRKSFDQLREDAENRTVLMDLLDAVQLIADALDGKPDGAAVLWGAARAHNALAVLLERHLPEQELRRVWNQYDVPGGK